MDIDYNKELKKAIGWEWNYIDSKIEQALEQALDEVHKND